MMRAAQKDSNQAEIVTALRSAGCSVEVLEPARRGGLPDLLVGFRGKNVLLEVKAPEGRLSLDQEVWHGCWRGDKPHVVTCAYQALVAVGIAVRLPAREAKVQRIGKLGIVPRKPRMVPAVRRG
jgi:hypothetical protein